MGTPTNSSSPSDGVDTLIFDLGDVLFEWSVDTTTPIPPKQLHRMLGTATWFEYEKGNLTEEECHSAIAREFGFTSSDVDETVHAAVASLRIRPNVFNLIKELKSGHRVFAMTNMAAPHWEFIRGRFPECDVFDHVFTSAAARERKPNLGFYRHVLHQTGADPRRTVFVDDQLQNVVSARSLGIRGLVYNNYSDLERSLRNIFGNPIERAWAFLRVNAGRHLSYTDTGFTLHEQFTALLILETTGDESLVNYTAVDGPWSFFPGETELTTPLPPDLDTTALAYTIVPHAVPDSTKHRVMDEILANRTKDGIVPVYFSKTRQRIDANVSVNVLHMFYTYGRGNDVRETLDWVCAALETRAYVDGTDYYVTAETFLFFLSRLLHISPEVRERIGRLYKDRCQERVGLPGDALALAMRVICCREQAIDATVDAQKLHDMQEPDGGWKDGWFYKYRVDGLVAANRGFTTALAIKALKLAYGS
ncbi:hypothetical protein NM688_g2928 [Phlebia brevispora]|uniref:Uncharacterized protein n=1 Tax=Phlebia brevispora TaxID=194682 RepID=A0ACC1T738_9APHY|nr:hypothetical protein NM688_g2928 [Phlebia brevispora]